MLAHLRWVLLLVGVSAGASTLWASDSAASAPATIALGAVSSEVVRKDIDLGAWLRLSLARELGGVDLKRAAPRQVILSASLVRMDSVTTAGKVTVTCVVTALLFDVKRGTMFAALEGRARAENASVAPSLERAAMEAAVHSALARVPEAMK